MSTDQGRLIMKSFINCPLTWMNYNRELNNKIVRIVYRDKKSTFGEFLEKSNSVKTHIKKSPSIDYGNV